MTDPRLLDLLDSIEAGKYELEGSQGVYIGSEPLVTLAEYQIPPRRLVLALIWLRRLFGPPIPPISR